MSIFCVLKSSLVIYIQEIEIKMDRRSSLSKEELEKQNQRKMSAMALMDTNKMNKTKPRNTFNTFFLSDSD